VDSGGNTAELAQGRAHGLSTNALKIWAVIAMACDHIPYLAEAWQADYYAAPWVFMHAFGRLTAPIFFYLLVVGYGRTRDANRYTLRLLVFASITYLPYVWYFRGAPPNAQNFLHLDVIFTMLVGLLLLRALREVKNMPLKAACVVLCLLAGYWCDYGLYGIAMILVCDLARAHGGRRGTVLGMAAVMMAYVYSNVSAGDAGLLEALAAFQNPPMLGYIFVQLCQLLPLILIARHRLWLPGGAAEARPGGFAKWGFYIFYPAHITALLLIRLLALSQG
jgi:hypothetical protein